MGVSMTPQRRISTSVADDVRSGVEHLSDDRKHRVVRNIVTMTADTTVETEQSNLKTNTPQVPRCGWAGK